MSLAGLMVDQRKDWLTAVVNTLKFNNSKTTAASAALDVYKAETKLITFSGPINPTIVSCFFAKLGIFVSISIASFSAIPAGSTGYITAPAGSVPSEYLPHLGFTANCNAIVLRAGSFVNGNVIIKADGSIVITVSTVVSTVLVQGEAGTNTFPVPSGGTHGIQYTVYFSYIGN